MATLIELQERNGEAQDRRVAKAIAEEGDYQWSKSPLGHVVSTPSGGCYQVSERGCTCMDYQKNCCGVQMSCKHQIALRRKLAVEGPLADAKPVSRPAEAQRQDAIFDRLYC